LCSLQSMFLTSPGTSSRLSWPPLCPGVFRVLPRSSWQRGFTN
jgi:hypothetical protein